MLAHPVAILSLAHFPSINNYLCTLISEYLHKDQLVWKFTAVPLILRSCSVNITVQLYMRVIIKKLVETI